MSKRETKLLLANIIKSIDKIAFKNPYNLVSAKNSIYLEPNCGNGCSKYRVLRNT
jgi:hypothetical protein